MIDVGSVVDNAIESGGEGDRFSDDFRDGVVGFRFDHVGDVDDSDVDRGRGGLSVFVDDAVERIVFRGEFDGFFARTGYVTVESKLLFLIGLAAEREGCDGARERSDAHQVVALTDP